jgi:hypothetical protein
MCDAEQRASDAAARTQAAEEAARKHGESRHRWLFWGNLGSLAIGVAVVGMGASLHNYTDYVAGPPANTLTGFQWVPVQRDVTGQIILFVFVGILIAGLSAWSLRDAGGFKHKTYDLAPQGRKLVYWLGAATGLCIGIVFVIAAAIAVVFFASGAGQTQQGRGRPAARDGVGDAIDDARGHY